MDFKQKKDILNSYMRILKELEMLDADINDFRITFSMPGMGFKDGGSTNNKKDLSDYMVKYEKLMNRYYKRKYELVDTNTRIFNAISELIKPEERIVLHMRYIQGKEWLDIQSKLHLEEAQTYRIHKDAINHIEL